MISSRNQNQFPSSFAPLQDLLKALMFLSNFNGFNSSPLPSDQGFAERKGSSKMWKEKDSKWFSHSLSLGYVLLVCFAFLFLSQSSFYALLWLTCFCLFVFNFALFCFFLKIKKKIEKLEKYKNCVCFVYIQTCVPWMAIETKFSKLCIFYSLDKHLYAQLSKWALWLVFVMSNIK